MEEFLYFSQESRSNNILYVYNIAVDQLTEYSDPDSFYKINRFLQTNCRIDKSPTEHSVIRMYNTSPSAYIGIADGPEYLEIVSLCPSAIIDNEDLFKKTITATIKIMDLVSKKKKDQEYKGITFTTTQDSFAIKLLADIGFSKLQSDKYQTVMIYNFNQLTQLSPLRPSHRAHGRIPSIAMAIDNFPSLESWRDRHLLNLCYCIAEFFNYITIPRINANFMSVLEQNQEDSIGIKPKITWEQVNYLFSEIFPCGDMLKEGQFSIEPVPLQIKSAVIEFIRNSISNKGYLGNIKQRKSKNAQQKEPAEQLSYLEIEPAAIQLVWNYLSNGLNNLYYSEDNNTNVPTDKELEDKIK